jgi:hypothetical protein
MLLLLGITLVLYLLYYLAALVVVNLLSLRSATDLTLYGAKQGSWAFVTNPTSAISKEFSRQLVKRGFIVLSADSGTKDFEFLKSRENLTLVIQVNTGDSLELEQMSNANVDSIISEQLRFNTKMTRAIIPILRKRTASKSAIINVLAKIPRV